MLGEVIFGFLIGCISVLYYLLTSRPENDSERPPEHRAPSASRDACTAVAERILDDICRSEELRLSLESKLQRGLSPLASPTSHLKSIQLTGLSYPNFRLRLANVTQIRTEHADELRVEFDIWTEGVLTAAVRTAVQGSLLPQVPVDLVLTVRSIRGHAVLIVPPGRDPTVYLSFSAPPRMDMRVEAGRVRVEKLPFVGRALLERVHQLINKHLVAPGGGISFHFPIPKVRKLRFRMMSSPAPPVPPRAGATPPPPDVSHAPFLEVVAEEKDNKPVNVSNASANPSLSASLDPFEATVPAATTEASSMSPLLQSNLPPPPVPRRKVQPASQASDLSGSILSSPNSSSCTDSVPATPSGATLLPVIAIDAASPARPASPPAPPSLSSSVLFGPRSSLSTTTLTAPAHIAVSHSDSSLPSLLDLSVAPAPIPVPTADAEPVPISVPQLCNFSPSASVSLSLSSADPAAESLVPIPVPRDAPTMPPPIPSRPSSVSFMSITSMDPVSPSVIAPVAPTIPASPSAEAMSDSKSILEAAQDDIEEERAMLLRGSASLMQAEARLAPETRSVNIGRFIVDDYDLDQSGSSPPVVPPRPGEKPPPVPPRPLTSSSVNVDD